MRHIKFTVEVGEMGLGIVPNIFKNWNNYYPTTYLGHDLIDHTTKEWGETWQEFRAQGAYIFNSNWLGFKAHRGRERGKTDIQILGEDFAENLDSIISDSDAEGEVLEFAPKVSLSKSEKDKFKYFWHFFRTRIESKYNDELEIIQEGGYSDYDIRYNYLKNNGEKILSWYKYGYALAKRRYKGEAYDAWLTKIKIDDCIQKQWQTLKAYEGTGEEFTLSYDVETLHAEITHKYGLV